MLLQPVDLLGGFYTDASKAWADQDVVNWRPVLAETRGTRTPAKLMPLPGMRKFTEIVREGRSLPIRGAHNAEGRLFVVSGPSLFQVRTDGTYTYIGNVPGVGRVRMEHNQITNGNELIVTNGQGGGGYIYNTVTKAYTHITDTGFPGARSVAYQDSYFLMVEPAGRYWFNSDLANGMAYNEVDRYESEGSPDTLVAIFTSQFEVIAFNQRTIEFFANTGATTGTFQNKRILIEVGCASQDSIVTVDNSPMWLGNDGVVYRLDGYKALPISTGPVQEAIASAGGWAQAFATAWEDSRSKVYYLTLPNGQTWGYDAVSRLWHRRQSFGLERWRLNTLTEWNGQYIGGDFQNGQLWVLDQAYMMDGDDPFIRERRTQPVFNAQNWFTVAYLEMLVRSGDLPEGTITDGDRTLQVCYSDDGGYNWSNWRLVSLGETGHYAKRVRMNRMGRSRQRCWRIRTSSPIPTELHGAVASMEAIG